MYLSPIQCGIQSAHCIHDMFNKYIPEPSPDVHATSAAWNVLNEWSREHKTMIVLNGGTSEDLNEVFQSLWAVGLVDLPFQAFYEPGIGDALTCVGVILTTRMVEAVQHARGRTGETDKPMIFVNECVPGDEVEEPLMWVNRVPGWNPKWTEDEWNLAKILASKPLA
jgi:hypothetical protein